MVAEVVEEGDDVVIALQLIVSREERTRVLNEARHSLTVSASVVRRPRRENADHTHTCWKRLILSRMLNCCHLLEKLTFPSIRSGFPRWTKVKSCRMSPLGKGEPAERSIALYPKT